MKKLLLMAAVALFTVGANAQNTNREPGAFTIQPKVGIGIGSFAGEYTSAKGVDTKVRVGLAAGAEGEYYINNWFSASLGAMYAMQGWKLDIAGETYTYKLDYVNIPLLANFYVAKGLALKAGVQLGILASAKREDVKVKDNFKSTAFSIPVGISYEYADFVLDARYNIPVSKISDGAHVIGTLVEIDNKIKNDYFLFTIGYKIQL